MVVQEHLQCCMLCRHSAKSRGATVFEPRCCIGPLKCDCMFAHELRDLRMPLPDPSGRPYGQKFFGSSVCIYVGQQYRPCTWKGKKYCPGLKRLVVAYAGGVPSHELPLWYELFQWVENGCPVDWPEMREVWGFGHYQLVDEWLRSHGITCLPFDTRWLQDALHSRRMYLGQLLAVSMAGFSLGSPAPGDETVAWYVDELDQAEAEQEVEAEEEEALQYDDALEEAEVEQDVPKYDDAAPRSLPRGSVGQYFGEKEVEQQGEQHVLQDEYLGSEQPAGCPDGSVEQYQDNVSEPVAVSPEVASVAPGPWVGGAPPRNAPPSMLPDETLVEQPYDWQWDPEDRVYYRWLHVKSGPNRARTFRMERYRHEAKAMPPMRERPAVQPTVAPGTSSSRSYDDCMSVGPIGPRRCRIR